MSVLKQDIAVMSVLKQAIVPVVSVLYTCYLLTGFVTDELPNNISEVCT